MLKALSLSTVINEGPAMEVLTVFKAPILSYGIRSAQSDNPQDIIPTLVMLNAKQRGTIHTVKVFGMTRSGFEPTTLRSRGGRSNH